MIFDADVAPRDGQWDLLEAYNRILRPTGYPRLTDAANATDVLAGVFDHVRRDILAEGWRFNSSFQTFTEVWEGEQPGIVLLPEDSVPEDAGALAYQSVVFQPHQIWWQADTPDINLTIKHSSPGGGGSVLLYESTNRNPLDPDDTPVMTQWDGHPVGISRALDAPEDQPVDTFTYSADWPEPDDFGLWYVMGVFGSATISDLQRVYASLSLPNVARSIDPKFISAESRKDGIVLRDDTLWNLERDEIALNYPYSMSVAEDVVFEDMPPLAQSYLVARAARVYWAYTSFNPTIAQALSVFELRTRASLIKAEGEPIILRNPYSGPGAYRAVTYSDVGRHYGTEGQALGQNY